MDKKAKNILFKTYWTATGWISEENRKIEKADFEYAKEKGLMFDPLTATKSEVLVKIKEIVSSTPIRRVTDAFLCSLTNKRLDWRSAFASYANAQRLLINNDVSDFEIGHGENIDLNILNFERIKWSGVRHNVGLYNWLDLVLIERENIPQPTYQDLSFRGLP